VKGRAGVERRGAVVRHALSNPDLRRVLAAYLLFNVAEWATWIALLVWGYGVGGVSGTGAIALVQLVPGALLAAPAAALLGRLDRGRALALGYACLSLGYLVLCATLVADAPVVAVGVAAVVSSVTGTLTRPTHHALLPEISRTTGDLTAGNAASGSLEALAAFLGPLASALLLATWGVGGVLLTMAGCSTVCVLLVARLAPGKAGARRRARDVRATQDLRTILRNPAARLMTLLIGAEYVLVGMMDILLVVLALDVLDMSDAGPGILNSAIGVGGIVGAALTFTLIGRARLAGPLVVGALGAGVAFAVAGQARTPAVVLLLVAVCGAGKLYYDVASRTFVQRLLPDHLLTAMFGIQEAVTMICIGLGTVAAPTLVAFIGVQGAFVAAGVVLPLAAVAAYRPLRRLDAGTAVPADVLRLLLGVPILAVLAPRIVERMARDAVAQEVGNGEVVVHQGDVGTTFYCIAAGRVRVDIDGAEIRELGPGDWFGEIALLRDVPRTASITALTDVSLWAVDRDSFLASVTAVPRSMELADTHIRDDYV
jgi:Na+/melibiose symporter-like transporter